MAMRFTEKRRTPDPTAVERPARRLRLRPANPMLKVRLFKRIHLLARAWRLVPPTGLAACGGGGDGIVQPRRQSGAGSGPRRISRSST